MSAVDIAAVRAAVADIVDPAIRRPLGELGMLGEITAGRTGKVHLELLLSTVDGPAADELQRRVRTTAGAFSGVRTVTVHARAMTGAERVELGDRLRARRPDFAAHCRVYAVASGKGGVGKSTVTANLAAALAATGQRVGVLDADVWGHSIPQLFGVSGNPEVVGGMMLPVPAHGVRLMSVGLLAAGQPVMWRGPMLHKAIEQMLADTYWDELDTLLIDLPPGTGDVTLSLLELLPDAAMVAVTTPQRTAHEVATRAVQMARQLGMPVAGVVENMSAACCSQCGHQDAVFGSGGGALVAESAGAPLIGQVPLDLALRESADQGEPVVLATPDAPSARALTRIAGALPAVRRPLAGRPLPLSVV